MLKLFSFMSSCLFFLGGCTGVSIKNKENQPNSNGFPVKTIYYDDIEEPIGCSKYSAYLFMLPDNHFVILRNRENTDHFLSDPSEIGSKYPSAKKPVKYSLGGNRISALEILDRTNDGAFKPYIYHIKYDGEHEDGTIYLRRSSWYEHADGGIVNDPSITWDFRKIREFQ